MSKLITGPNQDVVGQIRRLALRKTAGARGAVERGNAASRRRALLREAVKVREKCRPCGLLETAAAASQLGACPSSRRNTEQAEPVLVKCLAYDDLPRASPRNCRNSAASAKVMQTVARLAVTLRGRQTAGPKKPRRRSKR